MGAPSGPPKTDPLAIVSLVLGGVSLLLCVCCGPFAIPLPLAAIGCGIGSIVRINKDPNALGGKQLAIAGIAVGGVGLVLVIVRIIIMGGQLAYQLNQNGHY